MEKEYSVLRSSHNVFIFSPFAIESWSLYFRPRLTGLFGRVGHGAGGASRLYLLFIETPLTDMVKVTNVCYQIIRMNLLFKKKSRTATQHWEAFCNNKSLRK